MRMLIERDTIEESGREDLFNLIRLLIDAIGREEKGHTASLGTFFVGPSEGIANCENFELVEIVRCGGGGGKSFDVRG